MGEFFRVASVSQLQPGQCMETLAGQTPVALCNVEGRFHAVSNVCAHRGGPLGRGALSGSLVICPWHAWAYDVTTGASDVNPELRVPRFEVKVEGDDVLVRVG